MSTVVFVSGLWLLLFNQSIRYVLTGAKCGLHLVSVLGPETPGQADRRFLASAFCGAEKSPPAGDAVRENRRGCWAV